MKNRKKTSGLSILLGICAATIALTVLQILFFPGSATRDHWPAARALAIRVSLVNIVLAAGGMGALLYLGKMTLKKLNTLEELVKPIEKRNYAALTSFANEGQLLSAKEPYGELKNAFGDLGKFLEVFKVHAAANADLEKLLETNIPSQTEKPQENGTRENTHARLLEIESSAEQAISALKQLGDYFSFFSGTSQEQSQAIEEAGARLAETSELGQSIASALLDSSEKAGNLKDKINSGEEESRNTYDSIKNTSKDLEKITEMAEAMNQISEQANMLSMNAAIESAHAGAAGAGFAVVAEEIRKLADSVKENASGIRSILLSITQQFTGALNSSKISSETFGIITAEIAGFSESLAAAAENARKSGDAGTETKSLFEGCLSGSAKIRDSVTDIASFTQSFHIALENIQSLSGMTKIEAEKNSGDFSRFPPDFEKILDKIRDYLKETEELDEMLFKEGTAVSAAQTKTENETPRLTSKETDNSWRRDVAVKAPPRTVRR